MQTLALKQLKKLFFKTSRRLNINIILVANAYQNIPQNDLYNVY